MLLLKYTAWLICQSCIKCHQLLKSTGIVNTLDSSSYYFKMLLHQKELIHWFKLINAEGLHLLIYFLDLETKIMLSNNNADNANIYFRY